MKRLLLLTILVQGLFAQAQSTFTITTSGTTPQIDSAIQYCTDNWSQYLNSSIPIKINVISANLTTFGPLAVTLPNGERDFIGAPVNNVWYASCLANSISGTELNPGEADFDIYINTAVNYYYGTDGNPSGSQFDFVSVLMHEMAHGLGITSLSRFDAGVGSFGAFDSTNLAPLYTSFPFPQLDSLPSIWDSYLINNSGEFIADTALFPNVSNALGSEFQSNSIFFAGPLATTVNGGPEPRVFAPLSYEAGSSLQHFNEGNYPVSSGNSMMTPYIANGEVEHNPGPLLLAALVDIGWSVNMSAGVGNSEIASVMIYPNPSIGLISITAEGQLENLHISDVTGAEVNIEIDQQTLRIAGLRSGTYFLSGNENGIPFVRKISVL